MHMRVAFYIFVASAIVIGATSSSETETSFNEDVPGTPVRGTKAYAAKVKELDAKVALLNKKHMAKKLTKPELISSTKAGKKRKAQAKAIVKALQGHGAASGKNSLGADINTGGKHYKSKTVKRDYAGGIKSKVIPPGYSTSDTWKDPWGHYYLGPSRRRIGAGFGRRRRTVYYKKKSVSRKKSRKLLRKIMSFKKGKSDVHKRAHHKYTYRAHKLPKYVYKSHVWKHRHIGFAKKHIKHMWDTSRKKKKKRTAKKRKAKKKSKKKRKAVRVDDNFWMQLTQQLETMPPNLMDETPKP